MRSHNNKYIFTHTSPEEILKVLDSYQKVKVPNWAIEILVQFIASSKIKNSIAFDFNYEDGVSLLENMASYTHSENILDLPF